jgi:hypothetical protein
VSRIGRKATATNLGGVEAGALGVTWSLSGLLSDTKVRSGMCFMTNSDESKCDGLNPSWMKVHREWVADCSSCHAVYLKEVA